MKKIGLGLGSLAKTETLNQDFIPSSGSKLRKIFASWLYSLYLSNQAVFRNVFVNIMVLNCAPFNWTDVSQLPESASDVEQHHVELASRETRTFRNYVCIFFQSEIVAFINFSKESMAEDKKS